MIREEHKILINSYLILAVNINNGLITPSESFHKNISKIKNLKLSKNLPPEEVHEYIQERLIIMKCPNTIIKEFFDWTTL